MPEAGSALTLLGTVITALISYVEQMLGMIMENELALIVIGFFVIGGAIGIALRLIGR